jgi:L-iditol 2-dehydrogenase
VDAPGPGQVLVQVSAVGVCGSDVHYYEHGSLGPNVVRAPHILGHEFCGRVVATGAQVNGRIGERVAVEPGMACRACPACLSGHYNLCPHMRFLGAPPYDGALRGHIAVPAELAFPLPESISEEAGALIEPLAVAVWAVRGAGLPARGSVLITGAGPVGLLCAQVARAHGAEEVALVDVNADRLEAARSLGFAVVASAPSALPGDYGVLIECSGSPAALAAGAAAITAGGRVVLVGMAAEGSVNLSLDDLQRRELTVVGSFRYAYCYPEAIELAARGQVALEPLITGRYRLDEVPAALAAAREDPAAIKSVVLP